MKSPGDLAGAVGLLALLTFPAIAQQAPQQSLIPEHKPAVQSSAEAVGEISTEADAKTATDTSTEGAPETAPEPATEEAARAADDSEEPDAPPVPSEPPRPQQLAETDLDLGICLGRLAAFGTEFERGRTVSEEDGACGIVNPVRVTKVVPGVALSPPGIMRCETAVALAEWVSRFALPASTMLADRGPLTEVAQGSAYICRGINDANEGDMSEHAFGNAIDIMAFRFASGQSIPVEPRAREGTDAEAFQRAVRAAACLSFTTVLGPGEEAHDDHLHLDIKRRDSGYRLCR